MYRHFVLDQIMDLGGMENPDAVSEPEETQEIPETAELVSFHWHQNGMSYGDCFTFRIYVAGQDPPVVPACGAAIRTWRPTSALR